MGARGGRGRAAAVLLDRALAAHVFAKDAAVAWQRIDDTAHQPIPGDERTLPQRRAGAFVAC